MQLTPKKELILLLNYLFFDNPKEIIQLAGSFENIQDFKNHFHEHFKLSHKRSQIEPYIERLNKFNLDEYLQDMQKESIKFVFYSDSKYPAGLKNLTDYPMVLFYQGNLDLLSSKPILAVVGSREYSEYGAKVTEYFTSRLCKFYIICSGLAMGLDAIAHNTTLQNNGITIAIVANGLDSVHPKRNIELWTRIREKGLIMSEYPIKINADTFRFPQRNRLIAAISKGVLVAEAKEDSGTLITARLAAELGREVFVIPSSIFNPLNIGGHKTIQEGAKLVYKVDDVLTEFKEKLTPEQFVLPFEDNLTQARPDVSELLLKYSLNGSEEKIFQLLYNEGEMSIDQLVSKTNEPITSILNSITQLELQDLVKEIGSKYMLGDKLWVKKRS